MAPSRKTEWLPATGKGVIGRWSWFCELLPQMARHVDRIKIVRSVTHSCTVHTSGVYTMLTGVPHATPTVDQTMVLPGDHPHLGAIYSKWCG